MIRSSPQLRQAFLEVARSTDAIEAADSGLMLILDVVTRWSSTHQMLARAIRLRPVIDRYISRHSLYEHRLSEEDWVAIKRVTGWLDAFRYATTAMSASQSATLSTVFGQFLHLQDVLRRARRSVSEESTRLRDGIQAAHQKLAEYFGKFSQSDYFLWAARE
jgi:hypothetical protein